MILRTPGPIFLLFSLLLLAVPPARTEEKIGWRATLKDALEEAKQAEKPVLAKLFAPSSPPCKKMDVSTWSDTGLAAFIERHTIPVAVDIEQQRELGDKHGVKETPCVLLLDSEGKRIAALEGFRLPGALLIALQEYVGPAWELARAQEALEKNPNDARAHLRAAGAMYDLGQRNECIPHYVKVCELDPKNEKELLANACFALARMAEAQDDGQKAEKLYGQAVAADPEGKKPFTPAAMFGLGAMQHRNGDPAKAIATLEQLRVRFPQSAWDERAVITLEQIKSEQAEAGEKK